MISGTYIYYSISTQTPATRPRAKQTQPHIKGARYKLTTTTTTNVMRLYTAETRDIPVNIAKDYVGEGGLL